MRETAQGKDKKKHWLILMKVKFIQAYIQESRV